VSREIEDVLKLRMPQGEEGIKKSNKKMPRIILTFKFFLEGFGKFELKKEEVILLNLLLQITKKKKRLL
jgi:hypothetical protein